MQRISVNLTNDWHMETSSKNIQNQKKSLISLFVQSEKIIEF